MVQESLILVQLILLYLVKVRGASLTPPILINFEGYRSLGAVAWASQLALPIPTTPWPVPARHAPRQKAPPGTGTHSSTRDSCCPPCKGRRWEEMEFSIFPFIKIEASLCYCNGGTCHYTFAKTYGMYSTYSES